MLDFIDKGGNWDDSIVKEGKMQFALKKITFGPINEGYSQFDS